MGSFKPLRVTRNLMLNFSNCLFKTLTILTELFKSSSNFSILSSKLTSNPSLSHVSLQILLHCLLLIQAPFPQWILHRHLLFCRLRLSPERKRRLDPTCLLRSLAPHYGVMLRNSSSLMSRQDSQRQVRTCLRRHLTLGLLAMLMRTTTPCPTSNLFRMALLP